MGCILTFTINLRLASNRIGWVKINGRDYRVTSVVSPFFVYEDSLLSEVYEVKNMNEQIHSR